MGRASGLKDLFVDVLGEKRGLQPDQEMFSTAPAGIDLVHESADHYHRLWRRMEITRWMLIRKQGLDRKVPVFYTPKKIYENSDLYTNVYPLLTCLNDLEILERYGICQRRHDSSGPSFALNEVGSWPEEYMERYYAWRDAGYPQS